MEHEQGIFSLLLLLLLAGSINLDRSISPTHARLVTRTTRVPTKQTADDLS
jgi:hypothetical protein